MSWSPALVFRQVLCLGAMLLLATGPGLGQANQDIAFAGFQFNRSLPGARSLAMGGAFVALADDATAAYSNPSGLTLLTQPEVSTEYRLWEARVTIPYLGRISGEPTGDGIDTVEDLETRTFAEAQNGIAFASFVYVGTRGRWAAGAFHHVLANYSASVQSQGVFSVGSIPRFGPYRSATEFDVYGNGLSGALALGECVAFTGCLRIGLSVIEYEIDQFSRTEVIRDPPPGGRGAADFSEPSLAAASTQSVGKDRVLNGGLLWELGPYWRVAGVFRQGPRFRINERVFGPKRDGQLRLPDQIALGVAWQPYSSFTLSFEYDHVRYSSMTENNGFSAFTIDDASEFRIGSEYLFFLGDDPVPPRVALMAGVWFDPDHRFNFDRTNQGKAVDHHIDEFRLAYFDQAQETDLHWSIGVGINWHWFQTDIGVDWSDRTTTVALSTVIGIGH